MAVEVTVRDHGAATEVVLTGAADPDLLARLGEAVRAVAGPGRATILNMDGLTLLDGDSFGGLVGPLVQPDGFEGEVSVVCAQPRESVAWPGAPGCTDDGNLWPGGGVGPATRDGRG